MTLERLEEIEKNYKKVYEEELNKIFEMYPGSKDIYYGNNVVLELKPKKKAHFFFKIKRKDNIIKLNDIKKWLIFYKKRGKPLFITLFGF